MARTGDDRLDFTAYAGVFSAFFLAPGTPTPMTVAISGPWGSGKTSLARLIEDRLRVPENWRRGGWFEQPLTCWLDALAPGTLATTELRRLLRDGAPLSPVLAKLVRFEP